MKENSPAQKVLLAIAEKVLEKIEDFSDLGKFIINPHEALKGFSLYRDGYAPCRYPVCKGLYELKRRGFLEERGVKDKKNLYLSEKARIEIIKNILKKRGDKKGSWDEKWRAVVFDIPEITRKDRDFLRRELRWVGFKELQKSVWVFPFEIERELRALLRLWKLDFEGDIRFLIIEKMDDRDLRSFFNF